MPGPESYLILSGVLLAIGLYGIVARRNALVVLLSVEIMLNASNLALVTASRMHGAMDGQVFALLVMAIAAAEVVVGLGIIVALARMGTRMDTEELAELRG